MKKRMECVKDHFQSEANVFDNKVRKIIPYYDEMLEALAASIPFSSTQAISVADIGCGTGNAAFFVKKQFPNAQLTCVDLSQNMLDLAARKLNGMKNVKYELVDFNKHEFKKKFNAIVCSLALHHTESGKEKQKVFEKIYGSLVKGGVFVNADIVVSGDKILQKKYIEKWSQFILNNCTPKQSAENYKRYKREDRPAVLSDEFESLKSVGFKKIEIVWKYYNFAVYRAVK